MGTITKGLLALAVALVGCGGDDEAAADETFECTVERDGWEQCVDDAVQWCHGLGEPHFHAGRTCADDGLVCAARNRVAYCAAPDEPCETPTPGTCLPGQAVNCVDGLTAYRRCGVGTTCEVQEGWALCVDL